MIGQHCYDITVQLSMLKNVTSRISISYIECIVTLLNILSSLCYNSDTALHTLVKAVDSQNGNWVQFLPRPKTTIHSIGKRYPTEPASLLQKNSHFTSRNVQTLNHGGMDIKTHRLLIQLAQLVVLRNF